MNGTGKKVIKTFITKIFKHLLTKVLQQMLQDFQLVIGVCVCLLAADTVSKV